MKFRKACAVLLAVVGFIGCGDDGESSSATLPPLLPLAARRGADPGIFDSRGRQVLLRGVNLNSLGDYYQDNPRLPPVLPWSEEDFAQMAALGFNVVRLVLSWSALEPERGSWNQAYVQEIRRAVDSAKRAGVYVVLDMHQDAWGKFIATPPGVDCGPSRERAIGWDGAPQWATLTDGRSTCRSPGVRELSPAVSQAFENFYADRDGIQSAFVSTWSRLVAAFAQEPAVAGYDLFNEPHWGNNIVAATPKLATFYARLIPAIRAAERAAGGFPHIVFFEPLILWPVGDSAPDPAAIVDDNVVFAPHNYVESATGFSSLTIEQAFEQARHDAARYGTTFWIGEYGWFADPPRNQERLLRYATLEDTLFIGGAWWQWKQACGDPHSIGVPGREPPPLLIHLRYTECPGDVDHGWVPEWVQVLSRPYPRATPGRVARFRSDPLQWEMDLEGTADAPGEADLWIPDRSGLRPVVAGAGVQRVRLVPVAGGYRAFVSVRGTYNIQVRWTR